MCYLTSILHLCLAGSLLSHSCDLESEQEVYALLNIALYKTGGVERQLEGENTIPFFFLLSDSGLKFWKWRGTLLIESILRYCTLKTPPHLPSLFSLKCFLKNVAQQMTDAEGEGWCWGMKTHSSFFPSLHSRACSKWDRSLCPFLTHAASPDSVSTVHVSGTCSGPFPLPALKGILQNLF